MEQIKSEKLRRRERNSYEQSNDRLLSISVSCVENRPAYIAKAALAAVKSARIIGAECIYWISSAHFPEDAGECIVVHVNFPQMSGDFFTFTNYIYLVLIPRIVTTDYNLCVQSDGFAVNAEAWDDSFLDYDYIGAPWPWMWGGGPAWTGPIVGNGGFSLRSRKLYDALLRLNITGETKQLLSDRRIDNREFHAVASDGSKRLPEDLLITQWFGRDLERKFGIRFCHPNLANKFSVETRSPFTEYWLGRSFGFHGVVAAPHYGVAL